MDYLYPAETMEAVAESGSRKASLSTKDILIRGGLAGAILGFSETLSLAATVATGNAVVGAVLFPIGFIIIILLNFELFTGACSVMPIAVLAGRASLGQLMRNWILVYIGNMIGALAYAFLYCAVSTVFFTKAPDAVGAKLAAVAVAKTAPYIAAGGAGWMTALVKGILCNWMVSLGSVLGAVSRSVTGKAVVCWMPIMAFVVLGFEHSVVNMFAVPAGILLGHVTVWDWLVWNQIPVTIGNIVGGVLVTGVALYATFKPQPSLPASGNPFPSAAD